MKIRKPLFGVLAGVLTLACVATAADAPNLTFKFKTIDVRNALQTSPYGINNSGAVVGYYIDQEQAIHGLLFANGKGYNIDDPESAYGTEPINLNSSGVVVGEYITDSQGDIRGFVYQSGKFTDIGPEGCIESAGAGINDQGEIVGWCTDSSDVVHGYLWDGKNYSSLDYPGAKNFTLAWGINNAGLVTLQWIDSAGNYEGAVYNSKTMKYSNPITVPGAAQTYIHSINNSNDIVFSWDDSSGNSYGALLVGKQFYNFSDPNGLDYTRPDGINDMGEIVGRFEPTGELYEQGFGASY
jgi:probable HAF family extracellular repeat protein